MRALTALRVWVAATIVTLAMGALAPALGRAQTAPELPEIVSRYYIVIDAETGQVFAERGSHEHVAPASLTKIFTSIEALESAPAWTEITTTEADLVSWEHTQVGFGPGETFTLEELIYGMLVPSGNDAARAVARALGGQPGDSAEQAVGRFVERTNQRIHDMGLVETHLVNPDGWGVPNHYSSAHDIAAFTMYALKYPRFVAAISAETATIEGYRLTNTNKKMGDYDDLVGGKTGYDDTAGFCLMQVARRGGDTMIAVTLDGVAPDVWYADNRALLDYGFARKAAQRAAAPASAQFVRYLDPDAAVIQRMAASGVVVGNPGGAAPAPPQPPAEAATNPDAAPAPARAPEPLPEPKPLVPAPEQAAPPGPGGQLWLAAAVALLICLAPAARAFWRHGAGPAAD